MKIKIQTITKIDIPEINAHVCKLWGGNPIIVHLQRYNVDQMPGFKATINGQLAGFLHYEIREDECEILTLASLQEGQGVGSALTKVIEDFALSRSCRRVHLITTNDNLHALGFYQRRGFNLSRLFPNRVQQSRKMKPSIPELGDGGIPIRDEIELEKKLNPGSNYKEAGL